jgi:hypothetical protein
MGVIGAASSVFNGEHTAFESLIPFFGVVADSEMQAPTAVGEATLFRDNFRGEAVMS